MLNPYCYFSSPATWIWISMIVNKISGWWFGTFLFSHISGIIIPTDFHIFQGVETTNQNSHYSVVKFQPHHQWHQALPVSYWSPVTADDGQTYYYNLETGGVEVSLSLITLDLGKFHHDLTVLPSPGIMVKKGNDPQMVELFNLVNYYNVPRFDIPSFYTNVTTKIYQNMGYRWYRLLPTFIMWQAQQLNHRRWLTRKWVEFIPSPGGLASVVLTWQYNKTVRK